MAIDIAPFALLPFALRFWADGSRVPKNRWGVLTAFVVLLLVAAFLPARFFQVRPFPFQQKYLIWVSWSVLLAAVLFTVYLIFRVSFRKKEQ